MQSWLEGRIWVGKGAQATGMTASLRILSSKADSNTCESFTRSGLKLESVHQESPRSDVFRKRATKPLLNQRQRQKRLTWLWRKRTQWSKVLFSDESKFCISFGNQGPRVWRKSGEAQNPCCLKSSVKFPQSVMIWAAMSSAGVGPLCFLKSTVNAAIYQEIFRALPCFLLLTSLWRCWFHFPAGLGTCPHCQRYQKLVQWPWCYCAWLASKLAWPEPIENLWGIVKRKMRDTRPNNADELKATVKETWASIPPQQCHKLIHLLNYFSLCALNLFNTQVSQFELNYWNKSTFPRHSNLLRCTCSWRTTLQILKKTKGKS